MKNFKLTITFLITLSLLTTSCSESNITDDEILNSEITKSISDIQRYGYVSGMLLQEFLVLGEEEFNQNIVNFENYINGNDLSNQLMSGADYANLLNTYFNIEKNLALEYINLAIMYNQDIAENQENIVIFENGINEYLAEHKQQNKWGFMAIASLLDAGCGASILAGIVDTAIMGAAMVITTPTRLGAIIGGVGVASAYATTINTVIECYEP
jgi:hypothetical protein